MELHFRVILLIVCRGKHQIRLFFNGKFEKIPLFHWDPFLNKPLLQKTGAPAYPLHPDIRRYLQKYFDIVYIPKIRMVTVGTLNNIELLWLHRHRRFQAGSTAVIRPVGKWDSSLQRLQDFLPEPLIVHIPSGLQQPLRGSLFRSKKKIVHPEQIAVIFFCQIPGQSALSGGAAAVNGNDDLILISHGINLSANLLNDILHCFLLSGLRNAPKFVRIIPQMQKECNPI